jgi:hypothetical protein
MAREEEPGERGSCPDPDHHNGRSAAILININLSKLLNFYL